MRKFSEWLFKNVYDLVLAVIAILNLLPILAPVLAYLNINFLARAIYFIYSFFCHQLHWRSMHICDYQYGWCTRCTFMWFNILLTGILVKIVKIKKVNWYWYGIFFVPMALDGIIQTIATMIGLTSISGIYYMSNNFTRMVTGSFFGIGFGLVIWQNLLEGSSSVTNENITNKKRMSIFKISAILLLLSLITYFLMVLVWDLTSSSYKPANLLDLVVKIPVQASDFLVRGLNEVK